jgi:hypothetical protein
MLAHRPKGTAITVVLGAGETHGQLGAGPRALVIELMEAYFRMRVPADADGSKGPIVLNEINEASGAYWLGDIYTLATGPYPTFPGRTALQNTSFLPTEELAKKWAMVTQKLPAMYKIDSGGTCTGCYGHPADEPPGAPSLTPTDAGAPPAPTPMTEDAGAAPEADAAAAPAMADAATPAPQPDPPTKTPPSRPPAKDAAASKPEPEPGDSASAAGSSSGGCTFASAAPGGLGGVLFVLGVLLASRRRR